MSYHVNDKRFFVKIYGGPAAGGNPCIYLNKDFSFENFSKWMWFFEYRAALYKVKNPKHRVDLSTGNYDYLPPIETQLKTLKNKIVSKKGKITQFETQLRMVEQKWNEIFPIQDDIRYKNTVNKINSLKDELKQMELQYQQIKKS